MAAINSDTEVHKGKPYCVIPQTSLWSIGAFPRSVLAIAIIAIIVGSYSRGRCTSEPGGWDYYADSRPGPKINGSSSGHSSTGSTAGDAEVSWADAKAAPFYFGSFPGVSEPWVLIAKFNAILLPLGLAGMIGFLGLWWLQWDYID